MSTLDTITAIDAHAKRFGLKVTTIGQMAVGNRHAYDRIKSGRAHILTAQRIAEWIERDAANREMKA